VHFTGAHVLNALVGARIASQLVVRARGKARIGFTPARLRRRFVVIGALSRARAILRFDGRKRVECEHGKGAHKRQEKPFHA
jgi:hypothetical protein